MTTNVSEKDKTLHEVIDFLEKEWEAANNASDNPDEEVYDFYDGMTTAYEHVINYCRHLLGYSGTMPSGCLTKARTRRNSYVVQTQTQRIWVSNVRQTTQNR